MEWIDVNDRLPEKLSNERFDRDSGWSEKVVVIEKGETYFGNYNTKEGEWRVYNRLGNIQVSHWMPLPELPKKIIR